MAIEKKYALGKEHRTMLKEVAEEIGGIIGKTIGPAGRNYLIPSGITNDGRTIMSHIRYKDENKDQIAMGFEEIAIRADSKGGDGTTTALVVGTKAVETIVDEIPDLDEPTGDGKSAMEVMAQLEAEKDQVIDLVKKASRAVQSVEELERVAFTSMEDRKVAKLIAEAMWKGGKDSLTAIDEGFSGEVESDVMSGIKANVKLAAPFFLNAGPLAQYEACEVLVANHDFTAYKELTPFMEDLMKQVKARDRFHPLVIVARSFSVPFIQSVRNVWEKSKGEDGIPRMRIVCVGSRDMSDDDFEDVASYCGAILINTSPRAGGDIKKARWVNLGTVQKFVSGKDTVFIGGRGDEEMEVANPVEKRVDMLLARQKEETDKKKREEIDRRIAKLQGGIVTIYVDAPTAVEKYYLKLKVQDALNSCKHALEDGMVRGGGLTLSDIAEELGEDALLYEALKEPHARIKANAGGSIEVPEEIMDASAVVISSVENAVSGAKLLLTTEGNIADHAPTLVDDWQNAISQE